MSHMHARVVATLTTLALLILSLVSVSPANAVESASVSGAITGPGGTALVDVTSTTISLQMRSEDFWESISGVDTVVLGPGESTYSFSGLEVAYTMDFRVIVTTQGGSYAETTVSQFLLSPGQSLTHDVALALGASASGTVVNSDGSAPTGSTQIALEKWEVWEDGVESGWEQQGAAKVLAPGETAFAFSHLSAGDYRFRLIPASPYVVTHSEAFSLDAGESRAGVKMKLALPASVKVGIVGGQYHSNLWINIYRQSNGRWETVFSDNIAAKHTSRLRGKLEPGTYRVGIVHCASRTNYSPSFTLKSGQAKTGVTVTLPSKCSDAPASMKLASKTGTGRARIYLSVTSTGVPTSRIDGKAKVSYHGKVLAWMTVTDGKAKVLLTGQRPGTRSYRVTFTGSTNGWVDSVWKTIGLTIK